MTPLEGQPRAPHTHTPSAAWPGRLLLVLAIAVQPLAYAQDSDIVDLDLDELVAVEAEADGQPIQMSPQEAMDGNTINIGLLLPLVKFPEYSRQILNATDLALAEINGSGGVLGRQLRLIPADDASTSRAAVAQSRRLVEHYGVKYLVGPSGSTRFIAVANEVAVPAGALLISPAVTSPAISALDDQGLVFRTALSDTLQAQAAARFAFSRMHQRRAGILHVDNTYGRSLANAFKQNFERLGGTVQAVETYSPLVDLNYFDVTPRLQQLLSAQPDVLYMVLEERNVVSVAQKLDNHDLYTGARPRLIGAEAIRNKSPADVAKLTALEGMHGTAQSSARAQAFMARYAERFGTPPTAQGVANTYDIVYLIALALLEANQDDAKAVARHLTTVSSGGRTVQANELGAIRELLKQGADIDFNGESSDIEFDAQGDVSDACFEIWRIENGKFVIEVPAFR